jgi:ABC-type branched-subunit amino acid transport system ATPase component/ABC-type branched-subunit amino acid transport system permease subunit
VVRRLRNAPVIITVIATLGLGQFVSLLSAVVNRAVGAGNTFPEPVWVPTFNIGALLVTPAYSATLLVTPFIVLGLAMFLRRGRFGLGMRAAAANPDAARMSGVLTDRMSTLSWALAGGVAAYTAILVLPTRSFISASFLGPGLLLRALACAVVARMTSLPVALVAGLGLGVVEQVLLANYPSGGVVEAVLFLAILAALLLQRTRSGRGEEKGTWAAVQPWAPLPDAFRRVWAVRNLGRIVFAGGLVVALLLPLAVSNSSALTLSYIAAFSLVGLSVGVVTGLAGQLSLGQFALAGVGATASYVVTSHGVSFVAALVAAAATAALVSLVVGLPALRIHGLMLAVTTLGFALAAQDWLFNQSWMLGTGVSPRRPVVAGMSLNTGKRYYYFSLVVLLVGLWAARNIWRAGLGRRLRAVRDNVDAARAFTIPATAVKLQAFVLAGALAGLGGAVYGHSLSQLASSGFPVDLSINAAAATVIGGIGVLVGPLLGTLYIIGVPQFLPLDNAELAATSLGWLVLILQLPGGLAQGMARARDAVVDRLVRRAGLDPAAERAARPAAPAPFRVPPRSVSAATAVPPGEEILAASGLTKTFGGLMAVDDVSFSVRAGEILGLIGPNGAGKTTCFELLSGFTRADRGAVTFKGRDITRLTPEERGRIGLIRSFQDAALFPTLTVIDTLMLALERIDPTRVLPALLGALGPDRRKLARAYELAGMMGLYGYRNAQIRELSTGTRRIVELACLTALEPEILLLDEPTSGIAQRETEALEGVLRRIQSELGLTLVLIEHDMPLIMSLSDRIIAMESGRVLAEGSPEDIRANPLVISSYLGGDVTAIERSGAGRSRSQSSRVGVSGACAATTRAGHRCSRPAGADGLCPQHRRKEVGAA